MIKKFFSITLTCTILLGILSLLPISAAQAPVGTPVGTEQEFLAMSSGGQYYLSNDIALSQSYSAGAFSGTFDGNGHKITLSGNNITSVFPDVDGTVKNLVIEGNISLSSSTNAAALAINGKGRFENITSKVNITVAMPAAYTARLSGIVAVVDGNADFVGCKNLGNIQINTNVVVNSRSVFTGGLVCFANGDYDITFTDCQNSGSITSNQGNVNVGGIMGWSQGADVSFLRCVNEANLHSLANSYTGIGGMLGGMYNKNQPLKALDAKECVNRGKITGGDATAVDTLAKDLYAGGVIGQVYSVGKMKLVDCVNEGVINIRTGQSGSAVGGMAGMFITVSSAWSWAGFDEADYHIVNCVNKGELTGLDVGGMTGSSTQLGFNKDEISLTITNCVNTADLWGARYASGIAGRWANSEGRGWSSGTAEVTISNCMNTGVVEGVTSAAGIFVFMESEGILSERKTSIDLGAKIGDSAKVTLIQSCVNAGEIICNSGSDNSNKAKVAAGIIAHTNRNITVKNCVNIATLDMPANDDPCLVQIISTGKTVTASGNIYLDGVKGIGDNASAVAKENLLSSIGDDILGFDAPELLGKVAKAKALDAKNYESESYEALMSACRKVDSEFSKATDITRVSQKKVATLSAEFDECMESLEKLPVGSTPDEDVKDPSTEKPEENDPSTEKPEDKEEENSPNPNEGTKPTDPTVTYPTDATNGVKEEGGCGSTVGAAALITVAIAGLGIGITRNKE